MRILITTSTCAWEAIVAITNYAPMQPLNIVLSIEWLSSNVSNEAFCAWLIYKELGTTSLETWSTMGTSVIRTLRKAQTSCDIAGNGSENPGDVAAKGGREGGSSPCVTDFRRWRGGGEPSLALLASPGPHFIGCCELPSPGDGGDRHRRCTKLHWPQGPRRGGEPLWRQLSHHRHAAQGAMGPKGTQGGPVMATQTAAALECTCCVSWQPYCVCQF